MFDVATRVGYPEKYDLSGARLEGSGSLSKSL